VSRERKFSCIPRGIKTSTAVGKTTRIGEQPTVAYHAEKYSMKQARMAIKINEFQKEI